MHGQTRHGCVTYLADLAPCWAQPGNPSRSYMPVSSCAQDLPQAPELQPATILGASPWIPLETPHLGNTASLWYCYSEKNGSKSDDPRACNKSRNCSSWKMEMVSPTRGASDEESQHRRLPAPPCGCGVRSPACDCLVPRYFFRFECS